MKKPRDSSLPKIAAAVLSLVGIIAFCILAPATPLEGARPIAGGDPGDINQDGNVDLLDDQPFQELLLNGCEDAPNADIDQDGRVTLLDYSEFLKIAAGG